MNIIVFITLSLAFLTTVSMKSLKGSKLTDELKSIQSILQAFTHKIQKPLIKDTKEDNLKMFNSNLVPIINQLLNENVIKTLLNLDTKALASKDLTLEEKQNLEADVGDLRKLSGTVSELADLYACVVKIIKFLIGFLSN